MKRILIGVLLLQGTVAYGQVNFEVDAAGQGPEPEEMSDGWDGDFIRIAYDKETGQSNGVSFDSVVQGEYELLQFDFEFRVSQEPDTPEGVADGIGFAYANLDIFGEEASEDDPVGGGNGGWGTGEEPDLEGSLGVGFDTWNNAALDDDAGLGHPDGTLPNSFSLHYDSLRQDSLYMEEYGLDDDWIQNGNVKRAHIDLTGAGLITVTVEDLATGEKVEAFKDEEVLDFDQYDGRVAFRARTGGEWSHQDVDNISVTHTPVGGAATTFVLYGQHVGGGVPDACDYDGDGSLGEGDINMLSAAIAGGDMDAKFDVNGDGAVNVGDLNFFIGDKSKLNTWLGDANLDGEFGSADLVAVFSAGKYEKDEDAVWSQGDWNADLRFGSGDLVAAFSDGGYELGPKPMGAAVPEPTSFVLMLIACGLTAGLLRRRQS